MHFQVCAHRVTSAKSLAVAVQRSFYERFQVLAQQRWDHKIHSKVFSPQPGLYGLVRISFAASFPAAAAAAAARVVDTGGGGIHTRCGPW